MLKRADGRIDLLQDNIVVRRTNYAWIQAENSVTCSHLGKSEGKCETEFRFKRRVMTGRGRRKKWAMGGKREIDTD